MTPAACWGAGVLCGFGAFWLLLLAVENLGDWIVPVAREFA